MTKTIVVAPCIAMAIILAGGPTFEPSFDGNPKNWSSGPSARAIAAVTSSAAAAAQTGRNGFTVMVEFDTYRRQPRVKVALANYPVP